MSFIMCESHKFTYPKKKATIEHCCEQNWFQNRQILKLFIRGEIDFYLKENSIPQNFFVNLKLAAMLTLFTMLVETYYWLLS